MFQKVKVYVTVIVTLLAISLGPVSYTHLRKIGALVSIEQTQTLQEQIATGIPLDAVVTGELLINIFIPNTPLHDGAVIIRDNKVATACSYLPLTESCLLYTSCYWL